MGNRFQWVSVSHARTSVVDLIRSDWLVPHIAASLTRTMGSQMKYKVIFMVGEKVLGSHTWVIGLDSAKQHAMDFLPVINADQVEVRDEKDVIVFHHTRTPSPQEH